MRDLIAGGMKAEHFKAWRDSHGMSRRAACIVLGLSLEMPRKYEAGTAVIPHYVALACSAYDAGLKPWHEKNLP